MKIVEAKLVSVSKEQKFKREAKRAQIIVCLGEGSERRSVTRHVVQQSDGSWIGKNPDDQAEKLHVKADETLIRAQAALNEAERALVTLRKANEDKKQIAEAEKKVAAYAFAVKKLGEEKKQLDQDYPLIVQFKF